MENSFILPFILLYIRALGPILTDFSESVQLSLDAAMLP